MDRIVVLGSRGFVGKSFLDYLQVHRKEAKVLGLSSIDLNLEKHYFSPQLEISPEKTTLVICSGLKRSHGEALETFERNMKIAHNLYLLTTQLRFKKIIYLSSCAVYGEDVAHPLMTENQVLTPTSFYGISKASTEYLLQKSCVDRLVILRPPTIYGAFTNPQNYDPYGFLNKVYNDIPFTLWGDGTELREFLYINDLHKIIDNILSLNFTGILNTCSGTSYSFINILEAAKKITGNTPKIESKPRSKEKVDNRFSPQKIHSVLPNFRFTSLSEGLTDIFNKEFKK